MVEYAKSFHAKLFVVLTKVGIPNHGIKTHIYTLLESGGKIKKYVSIQRRIF